MKLYELKSLIGSIVSEEINKEQLQSAAQTLHIPVNKLRAWVISVDPTPRQSFSVWILRMLKKQQIRFEDSLRVGTAINRFIQLRNARRIEDIMQFPTLNDLEAKLDQLEGQGSKRQGFAGINPVTLPGVEVLETRPDIILYKVTDPTSLAKIGEGTKWCTRFSYEHNNRIAESYLRRYGYLVVGYKDGKPYIQYNPDYTQVMDVNDVDFHRNDEKKAKQLNLPPPEIAKRPVPKLSNADKKAFRTTKARPTPEETPGQAQLRQWLKYTTQHNPEWLEYIKFRRMIPDTKGKDANYELRVANAILRSTHPFHIMRVLSHFIEYATHEIPGQRSEVVEKAILQKDFKPTMVAGKGGSGSGKRAKIPGIESIILYVKNNIKTNWPAFEQKIQDDAANSVKYYLGTDLNPDNIPDGTVKDLVLFSKFANGKRIASAEKFETSIADFIQRARKQLKSGAFSPVLYNVIIPYVKLTKKPLMDIIGFRLYNDLVRNNASFARELKKAEHSH